MKTTTSKINAVTPSGRRSRGVSGDGPTTKHGELTQALTAMVAELRPGDRLPPQEELMRRFGVSDTTVLRSLDDLKRAGHIVRRRGSGTFVAESLPVPGVPVAQERGVRTGFVAVMARPSSGPLFSELIQSVEASLLTHDMAPVLIVDAESSRRVERARVCWNHGDILGAIHVGSTPLSDLGNMPTVLMGETTQVGCEWGEVSLDNVASGRCVGEYLWEQGHRQVAVLTIGASTSPEVSAHWEMPAPRNEGVDQLRVSGMRALWQQKGGDWRDDRVISHPYLLRLGNHDRHSIAVMRAYLEPIFQSDDAPTAIFAVHDEMAIVAIIALESMGLRVPEQVSVVGFNDSGTLATYFRPALTTVRTPSATLGALAVHMFQDLLRDPTSKPRSVRLPPELIVRDSTGPARASVRVSMST